jgi:hypothetical protein
VALTVSQLSDAKIFPAAAIKRIKKQKEHIKDGEKKLKIIKI